MTMQQITIEQFRAMIARTDWPRATGHQENEMNAHTSPYEVKFADSERSRKIYSCICRYVPVCQVMP